MRALANFSFALLYSALALFRIREEQAIVELALRQQLAVYAQNRPRPRLSPFDRAFWVALSRRWPRWKEHLVLVRPETVVRWHRQGFRCYWRSISTPGPGRPPISKETRALIIQMATENDWGARKIQAELSKLGIRVGIATVSRYMPKAVPDPSRQQRWITFLRNHREVIAGMDFFVVPTIRFRLLYVWFAIDHGRRKILHFNVTANPSAHWVIQQLREAFPDERTHRFVIYDNDSIFSSAVTQAIESFGMNPKRIAFRSPWQNGTAEPFGWKRSPRTSRSRRRPRRGSSQTVAPRVRRLLQLRACPHLDCRCTVWSTGGATTFGGCRGDWNSAHRRSPPLLSLARNCLSGIVLVVDQRIRHHG